MEQPDRELTLRDAERLVGKDAVAKLYQAGFVVLDRLQWRGHDGRVVGVRRDDLLRAASRFTGLPLSEVRGMLDGPGAPPAGADPAMDAMASVLGISREQLDRDLASSPEKHANAEDRSSAITAAMGGIEGALERPPADGVQEFTLPRGWLTDAIAAAMGVRCGHVKGFEVQLSVGGSARCPDCSEPQKPEGAR